MDNQLPDELLRRIHVGLREAVAREDDPLMRRALMDAVEAGTGVTVHKVTEDGREAPWVFVNAELDDGRVARIDMPGALFGLVIDDDGDLAW